MRTLASLALLAALSGCARASATALPASRPARPPAAPVAAAPAVTTPLPALARPWSERLEPDTCAPNRTERTGTLRSPNTGDPLPRGVVHDLRCRPETGATWWLGREPHVPLAVVREHEIETAGSQCCPAFSQRDVRWRAVDAYGQLAGLGVVTSGDGYDATQCFELCISTVQGSPGIGIYASESGPWQPPPSARWVPDDAQRRSYGAFLTQFGASFADVSSDFGDPPPPEAERTLFFQMAGSEPGRFAVTGGRMLLLSMLQSDGRWLVVHIDPPRPYEPRTPRMPLGVFDMDGDGVPEVLVHFDGGDGWQDVVLQSDTHGRSWREAAQSVGGSTA